MTASDAAGSTNPSEADVNVDAVDASSGVLPSGPAQTPVPGNPPTGGPMDNSNPTSTGAGGGAGTRVEISQGGMDPTAERILISVGSIGMSAASHLPLMDKLTSIRWLRSPGFRHLDGMAVHEEVEESRQCQQYPRRTP